MAKLDAVLVCVALLAIAFVCLLIFNRDDTVESLVPLATMVLGFSFVFGNSAQTLFESVSDQLFTRRIPKLTFSQACFYLFYSCLRRGRPRSHRRQCTYVVFVHVEMLKLVFSPCLSKNLACSLQLSGVSMVRKLWRQIRFLLAAN